MYIAFKVAQKRLQLQYPKMKIILFHKVHLSQDYSHFYWEQVCIGSKKFKIVAILFRISMCHMNWLNFSHCNSCSLQLNAGNCVWLLYSDHAKITWNIQKRCSPNTVHMWNTVMNLKTLYVWLSPISASIKPFILPGSTWSLFIPQNSSN